MNWWGKTSDRTHTKHKQRDSSNHNPLLWYPACNSVEAVMHKCTHACWVYMCVCVCDRHCTVSAGWEGRLLHRTGIRLQMDQHSPIRYRHSDTTGSASYSDSLLGRLIANTGRFVGKHCKWMRLEMVAVDCSVDCSFHGHSLLFWSWLFSSFEISADLSTVCCSFFFRTAHHWARQERMTWHHVRSTRSGSHLRAS